MGVPNSFNPLSPIRFSLPFPEKLSPAVGRRMEEEDLIYLKLVRFHTFSPAKGRGVRGPFSQPWLVLALGVSSGMLARSPRDNTNPAVIPLHILAYQLPVLRSAHAFIL